jgi:hypothetical protein
LGKATLLEGGDSGNFGPNMHTMKGTVVTYVNLNMEAYGGNMGAIIP